MQRKQSSRIKLSFKMLASFITTWIQRQYSAFAADDGWASSNAWSKRYKLWHIFLYGTVSAEELDANLSTPNLPSVQKMPELIDKAITKDKSIIYQSVSTIPSPVLFLILVSSSLGLSILLTRSRVLFKMAAKSPRMSPNPSISYVMSKQLNQK